MMIMFRYLLAKVNHFLRLKSENLEDYHFLSEDQMLLLIHRESMKRIQSFFFVMSIKIVDLNEPVQFELLFRYLLFVWRL